MPFWDTQPAPVRAVILDALLDEGERPLSLLHPEHAATIAGIAEALAWIERCETERASIVLSDYYERPVRGIYLDVAADQLADEKRADVLTNAQLVASLLTAKRAA